MQTNIVETAIIIQAFILNNLVEKITEPYFYITIIVIALISFIICIYLFSRADENYTFNIFAIIFSGVSTMATIYLLNNIFIVSLPIIELICYFFSFAPYNIVQVWCLLIFTYTLVLQLILFFVLLRLVINKKSQAIFLKCYAFLIVLDLLELLLICLGIVFSMFY